MAPKATVCLKRLASMLSDKREDSYSTVIGWFRCAISLRLLRSSLACLRGSTKSGNDVTPDNSRCMQGNSIGRTLDFSILHTHISYSLVQ